MDREAFFAELAKLDFEYTPELIEVSNNLLIPETLAPDESRATRDIAYGPHERQRFNLFRPKADARAPCLLFVHDGGFVMGDKGAEGAPFYNNVGAWAQREGLVGVTINYRLAPEIRWPEGRNDVIAAICHVADHAAEYGIDPDRIVIMGHSAGGTHIGDVVANPGAAAGRFAGAVLGSGFYDLAIAVRDPFKPQYFGAEVEDWSPMSSLPGLVASAVPCLFVFGERDFGEVHRQVGALVKAWLESKGRLPLMSMQCGHNHLTTMRQLGHPLDSLGPDLLAFLDSL